MAKIKDFLVQWLQKTPTSFNGLFKKKLATRGKDIKFWMSNVVLEKMGREAILEKSIKLKKVPRVIWVTMVFMNANYGFQFR